MAKVIPAVGVIVDKKRGKIHIIQNSKNTKLKNVAMGFFDGTGFHPIRASKDYDPDRLSDDSEGSYGGRRRRTKRKATKRKPAAKKKATKRKTSKKKATSTKKRR